jgi:Fic family protein
MRKTGKYTLSTTDSESFEAFVPNPLPPKAPPIEISPKIEELIRNATTNCRLLNVSSSIIPNKSWFIYGFVRKEAVISSQIEGTQSTLLDLLDVESDIIENNQDVEEITNYVRAHDFAFHQLNSPRGLPLSLRLIKEIHGVLMKGVRGHNKAPGEFRKSQNWVGGVRPSKAIFVPPPVKEMHECLDSLEKYIHAKDKIDPIVKIGLIHAQFETIHPFLDGNGRVGRLLISLLLAEWKILDQPLLYLSLYFKIHQNEYYNRLSNIRTKGDWEGWIEFYLEGVNYTAEESCRNAKKLFDVVTDANQIALSHSKSNIGAIRLINELPGKPIVSLSDVVSLLNTTKPTAQKTLDFLVSVGVLKEVTGRMRDKRYAFWQYIEVLGEGMD